METKQDVSRLFKTFGIEKKVVISLNENMYTIKTNLEDNWLFYTFFGFKELQKKLLEEGKIPKSFAAIGSGNGLDALGAYFAFDNIENLIITDIDPRVIDISLRNIEENISENRSMLNLNKYVGPLCQPLNTKNIFVDLVYGNLPNIPSDSEDINIGYKQSSLHKRIKEIGLLPLEIQNYLLGLQALFLRSAKKVLNKEGSALPIIGGRVPYDLFPEMFKSEGYNFQELCSGFKLQTEPKEVIPEYAVAEESNEKMSFDFYLFRKSKEHLSKMGITNPTSKINGKELKELLKEFRVDARNALELYKQGEKIGHTCHFFRAYSP